MSSQCLRVIAESTIVSVRRDNRMETKAELLRVFVYGTLKRGQCREGCWPHPPILVQPAFIRGSLYDLGSYPALVLGSDRILGEVWSFQGTHRDATLTVLDEIEDCHGTADDLYRRLEVNVWTLDRDDQLSAFTYFYAHRNSLREDQRVLPTNGNFCRWPN